MVKTIGKCIYCGDPIYDFQKIEVNGKFLAVHRGCLSMIKKIVVEVEPSQCLFCQYGEIPKGSKLPYPLCIKHWDVMTFVWDKAGIPWWVEEDNENEQMGDATRNSEE